MSASLEVAVAAQARLGEGPTWDAAGRRLLWVDILQSEVHAYDPASGADSLLMRTGSHVGAAKPRAGGGIVANLRDGIGCYEPDGAFRMLADLAVPGVRGNDAAVAPDGSLWAGTMRYDFGSGGGRLYHIRPDGAVTTVLDDVTISNGIGWSPDGRLMYYIDTPTGRIDVFDVAPDDDGAGDGANVRDRRVFVDVDHPAPPDGLTVDADGCVWTALYGGGRVHRYTPDARLDRVVEVPAPNTTACAFGGPDLRDLYITSARSDDPATEPARDESLAGALFVLPGAGQGLPSPAFAG
ncbi:MAG TPA: SMP-30/gluconolactonase/LRE family protein [Streptosporangiaceae bacterium]|jgi:sugar lactone lactonase YvrE|nr:SMP-30/gluconolactonase/LRE family protein [Streptosporangiaceae bacterium]